jgi:hypothetical protein
MATIKIGRKEYEIKEGDFLLDNEACIQFCSGDNRTLKREGLDSYRSLRIAQGLFMKKYKPIIKMFVSSVKVEGRKNYTRHYFTAQTIALLDKPNNNAHGHKT